jgi:hypothetical protein
MSNETTQAQLDAVRAKRAELATRKVRLCQEMATLNAKVRGIRVSDFEYRSVCSRQDVIRRELNDLEVGIIAAKAELHRLSDSKEVAKISDSANLSEAVCGLVSLAKKYQDFAGDTTRIASMRAMAATFAEEVRALIRKGAKP